MRSTPYRKTVPFVGDFINKRHHWLTNAKGIGVPGKLRRQDMLAIYELAYYSAGTIADLGTNTGLSSAIAAMAVGDSNQQQRLVVSIDIKPHYAEIARQNHMKAAFSIPPVNFVTDDAACWLEAMTTQQRQIGFVFADHNHEYDAIQRLCCVLPRVMANGSYVAFHDFTDDRFPIRQALEKYLCSSFSLVNVCGCTGIYSFRGG